MFRKNIFAGIIVLILLAGNIYLSLGYISVNKQLEQLKNQNVDNTSIHAAAALVLKEYLNVVLNIQGKTSSDDRIKLESDLIQLKDPNITAEWKTFIASKDAKISQTNAVKLIGLLEDKMTQ